MTASWLTNGDSKLLEWIGGHKVLTVKQLSVFSLRSDQVVRRRLRVLEERGIVETRERGYGKNRGRPENIVFLTKEGKIFLRDNGFISDHDACPVGSTIEGFSVNHELLVNWFRIHLLQIEKSIPMLSVQMLSSVLFAMNKDDNNGSVDQKHIPVTIDSTKSAEFIPDEVFSIRHEKVRNSLLFFLEVDMGTETIANMDRKPGDLRQKILNYQSLFESGYYKRYEDVFGSKLNGFRLLFLTDTFARMKAICRLVQGMPPSDFIWLTDRRSMFAHGLSAKIWARGGKVDNPTQSILGKDLVCETPLEKTISRSPTISPDSTSHTSK